MKIGNVRSCGLKRSVFRSRFANNLTRAQFYKQILYTTHSFTHLLVSRREKKSTKNIKRQKSRCSFNSTLFTYPKCILQLFKQERRSSANHECLVFLFHKLQRRKGKKEIGYSCGDGGRTLKKLRGSRGRGGGKRVSKNSLSFSLFQREKKGIAKFGITEKMMAKRGMED